MKVFACAEFGRCSIAHHVGDGTAVCSACPLYQLPPIKVRVGGEATCTSVVAVHANEVLRRCVRDGQLRWSRRAAQAYLTKAMAKDRERASLLGVTEIVISQTCDLVAKAVRAIGLDTF